MNKLNLIILSLLILTLYTCSKKGTPNNKPNFSDVFLVQGENELLIKDGQTIKIDKSEFGIQYFNKRYNRDDKIFHAAQVAFSFEKEDFTNFKIGDHKKVNPYLLSEGPISLV